MIQDDYFGQSNPSNMPEHFFWGALRLDLATAVRADIERQNYGMCPRYWYVDAHFRCTRCQAEYCFAAHEQRTWFEDYGFWVDAFPKHCPACRKALRQLKTTRQAYDATVTGVMRDGNLPAKRELATIIDLLYELGGDLPPRIHENRRILAKQLAEH